MKSILLVLQIFLFINITASPQSDTQIIIQKCLNFRILQDQIDRNDIINQNIIEIIHDNSIIPNNLTLTKNGDKVEFNDQKGEEGFMKGWTYEFIYLKVKSKKAKVEFKYNPFWKNCSDKRVHLVQLGSLFFKITIEFSKINNDWEIERYNIQDVKFNYGYKAEKCISEKYIKLRE